MIKQHKNNQKLHKYLTLNFNFVKLHPERYEIGLGPLSLLTANIKLHTGFGLVPWSMTLDDLERLRVKCRTI